MATEIELKLALPRHVASRVAVHPLLRDLAARTQDLPSTYFDTPDLALARSLVAIRLRRKGRHRLLTVKSAEPGSGGLAARSEWEIAAPPETRSGIPPAQDFAFVDNAALRQRLKAAAPRLAPIFTTRIRRTTWQVAFGHSRIEIALDRGHIESCGRRTSISELELELLDGEIDDLFTLGSELQTSLPLHPSVVSKAERGYALFMAQPVQAQKAQAIPLTPEQTPLAAFRVIALGSLEQLQRNETGIANEEHPEFVHQARVALRRLRSAMRFFAPILPSAFIREFNPRWRELAQILGEARDWDVFRHETLLRLATTAPPDALETLADFAYRRCKRAHRQAGRDIAAPEYSRLVLEFSAALFRLSEKAAIALPAFARSRLDKMAHAARRATEKPLSPASRHRLRLRLKHLRYASEFLPPLLLHAKHKLFHASVAMLQEELGRSNDIAVAAGLLAQLRRAIPATAYRLLQERLHSIEIEEHRYLEKKLRRWRKTTAQKKQE